MPLELLSRFRQPLMGLSILWVIFFPSRIAVPDTGLWIPLEFLKSSGYGGVEIFFLLSGLGLAFSWAKRPLPYLEFLSRRVLRILPAFWIGILLFHGLFTLRLETAPTIGQLAKGLTGLDFWISGECAFWFVPAIVGFYAAFPLLARLLWQENRLKLGWSLGLLAASVSIAMAMAWAVYREHVGHGYMLLVYIRIPLFLAGSAIGFALMQGSRPTVPKPVLAVLLVAGIAGLWWVFQNIDSPVRWQTGLWWFPFWVILLPLSLFAAQAMASLGGLKLLKGPNALLGWAGARSLELYIVHTIAFRFLPGADTKPRWFDSDASWNVARAPEYLGYLLVAFLGAEILARLCARFFPRG
jgi:peptidoglycan/LPS O-acetylase OafA/YrhL